MKTEKSVSSVVSSKNVITLENAKYYKVVKSFFLVVVWIVMGMFNQITSVVMLDLQEKIATDYEGISQSLAFMNIGKGVGSFIGGLLFDMLRPFDDVIMCGGLLLATVTVVIKPFSGMIEILGLSFALQGIAHGIINNVGNAMQIRMWGKKANPPLFLMHMGYPIGMFLAPLIARPYLGPERKENNTTDYNTTTATEGSIIFPTTNSINTTVITMQEEASRIEIPYLIISACILFLVIIFGIFYFAKPTDDTRKAEIKRESFKVVFSPTSCADGHLGFGITISTCLALFYFVLKNKDEPIQYYLFSFAVSSSLEFTKQEAALLDSMQGAGQAVGRLLSAVLRLCVPIQIMTITYLYLILGTLLGFYFLSLEGKEYLWVLTILFSLFSGPIWPAGLAWADRYIKVTGIVIAVSDIGGGIGGFVSQWIVGFLIDNFDTFYVIYCSLAASGCLCLLIVVMQAIGCIRGDRYKRELKRQLEEDNNNDGFTVDIEYEKEETTAL